MIASDSEDNNWGGTQNSNTINIFRVNDKNTNIAEDHRKEKILVLVILFSIFVR